MPALLEPEQEALGERLPLQGTRNFASPHASRIGGTFSDASEPPKNIAVGQLGRYYGFRRFHVVLLLISLIMAMPAATVVGPVPYLLTDIQKEFGVPAAAASLIASSVLMGSMLGVLICGVVSDAFGRRASLIAFAVMISLLNLLHLAIPHGTGLQGFALLILLRTLLGLPYGGLIICVSPYLMEFFGDEVRGSICAWQEFCWSLGTVYCITVVQLYQGIVDWRTMLALTPVMPTILVLFGYAYLPESPRWLLVSGHSEQAQTALDGIFLSPAVYGVAFVGKAPRVDLPQVADDSKKRAGFSLASWHFLCKPGFREATILCATLYVILAGVANTTWIWGPEIVAQLIGHRPALEMFKLSEYGSVSAIIIVMFSVDAVGRKPLMVFGYALWAVLMCFYMLKWTKNAIVIFWMGGQFASSIVWAVLPMYTAEVFPTEVRGTAVGTCVFGGRVASVIFPMIAGELLERRMVESLVSIFIFLVSVAAVLSACFLREMAKHELRDVCASPLAINVA